MVSSERLCPPPLSDQVRHRKPFQVQRPATLVRRLPRIFAFAVLFAIVVGVTWPERADHTGFAAGGGFQASQAAGAFAPLPAAGPPEVPSASCGMPCVIEAPVPPVPLPVGALPRLG